jgi:uncharacterized protein (TIGR00725 family)
MKQKHTICIAGGSDISYLGLDMIGDARRLGEQLAQEHLTVFAAAAPGFCFWVAKGVSEKSGRAVGFSPAATKHEHRDLYRLPEDPFSSIVYTGLGYPGRNLTMMRSSDALIVGPGQIETFHEFMTALEENKVVGVWEGPWQIDEAIHEVIQKKAKQLNVIFEKDSKKLIERITKILDGNK